MRRFLRGKIKEPAQDVLEAYQLWLDSHAPLPAQLEYSTKPLDYWINLNMAASIVLCGCPHARIADVTKVMRLGEMDSHASTLVKKSLTHVLVQMDDEDTEFVIQTLLLSGDLRTAYDMWHSQNRNAECACSPTPPQYVCRAFQPPPEPPTAVTSHL